MVNKMKPVFGHDPEEGHAHVGTRLTEKEARRLDELVEAGAFMNRADAVRTAIRQMISAIRVVEARRISLPAAKKEVLTYLESHDQAYASDISNDLELDYDLVLQVLKELRKSGEAEPAI